MRRTLAAHAGYMSKKQAAAAGINAMPELVQRAKLLKSIKNPDLEQFLLPTHDSLEAAMKEMPNHFSSENVKVAAEAALTTFFLHCESRQASLVGEGFYTIGPCGEEMMSSMGIVLRTTDPMALHYRHAAANIARQLKEGESLDTITLNRARGFCVSSQDPVTSGAHCALGGGKYDFIVTSTLASQMCPALGRAMGGTLATHLGVPTSFQKDFVSFVSLGDGSVHNGHFLSANNLAEFATYRGQKVPLLTCITDNGIAISFRNHGYVGKSFLKKLQMPVYTADGTDLVALWKAGEEAATYTRTKQRPAVLYVKNLVRRFGHAATDRQNAYMEGKEIQGRYDNCVLTSMAAQLIQAGVYTQSELATRCEEIMDSCERGFIAAHKEQKLTSREGLITRNAATLSAVPSHFKPSSGADTNVIPGELGISGAKAQVMRKHMNKIFDNILAENPAAVYTGEDVRHGGYYLVTDGLAKKYPLRVQDFPPDETSLVGVGMGYSQTGLIPIVEIPYAKYLDCGMDIFAEACMMNWLSNGRQPNGMIVRLQGFGPGVFGGNFHTHNTLHIPVGLDVVCYSNGRDYARGMRYAFHQASKGRMVMFVDCTELLNMRDMGTALPWEFAYTEDGEFMNFDDVTLYSSKNSQTRASTLVVAYGNTVVSALQAQQHLAENGIEIDVVDSPLLSGVSKGLKELAPQYDNVLFADVCKMGQNPLSSHMASMMNKAYFKDARNVRCIGAAQTYNPLGTKVTFTSKEDIIQSIEEILKAAAARS